MLRWVIVMIVFSVLSACQAITTPTIPASTRAPTSVPVIPTRTITVDRTPTQIQPTPMPSLTPGPDFSQTKVVSYAFLPGWRFMLTFEAPFTINGDYYALINENSALPYACEKIPDNPRRLRCIGPLQRVADEIKAGLYPTGSNRPVYETRLVVEMVPLVVPK